MRTAGLLGLFAVGPSGLPVRLLETLPLVSRSDTHPSDDLLRCKPVANGRHVALGLWGRSVNQRRRFLGCQLDSLLGRGARRDDEAYPFRGSPVSRCREVRPTCSLAGAGPSQ